jgi:membrane protein DedA with SNARE-associated domain
MGITLTVSAVALFALAYLGDSLEIPRHVYPSLLARVLGGLVLLAGVSATVWKEWRATRAR